MSGAVSYAGIGSRETPDNILAQMRCLAIFAQARGVWLRTGGADGADRAFLMGSNRTFVELFLPWNGFNDLYGGSASPGPGQYHAGPTMEAMMLAATMHPNWEACSTGARKLHARNMHIILGRDLKTPVDMVICWTKGGMVSGGTGQALRLAARYNIPIYNLFVKGNYEIALEKLACRQRLYR